MTKLTEESMKEFLTEKIAKWEPLIHKINENWRLIFAYPMFIIVFMVGSIFNDYMPFFLSATAVFVYIFVKNVLLCLLHKKRIYMHITVAAVLLILYVVYTFHFFS